MKRFIRFSVFTFPFSLLAFPFSLSCLALCLAIPTAARAQTVSSARPIVVQGAMDVETRALVARLADVRLERAGAWSFWHGTIDGHPVIVSKTLKGVANAAAATTIAIERYHPIAIVNQGTSGGLDPSLKLYDIVLGTSAVYVGAFRTPYRAAGAGSSPSDWIPLDQTAPDGSSASRRQPARFDGDASLLAAARRATPFYTRGRVVEGAIGTSDMWNDEVDRLLRFNKDYGTVVEEMETASAAQAARQLDVPFLGIRIVSDNATNGTAYDAKTSEACEEFVYEVVKAYVAQRRAAEQTASARTAGAPTVVGAWRLVSWDERLADGRTRRNARTVGSLIYSDTGRMCAIIIDPTRPVWRSRPPEEAELRATYDGLVAYCGSYDLHAPEGFVVHHVDIEKSPAAVGITRTRWFTFEGPDRLVLRIDPSEMQAAIAESRLVWERVHQTTPAR
jgi:adenosylhomocysteine nucleosidase